MPSSLFSLPKAMLPLSMLLLFVCSPAAARAVSIEANTTYTLDGTLSGFLENRLDGDNRFDQFLSLDISGTVTTGALTADGRALESILVTYTVGGGSFFNVAFGPSGAPSPGSKVGSVNPGAEGNMTYTNAALVIDAEGNIGAGVYTSSFDPNSNLPLGDGIGDLGISPNAGLSGNLGATSFTNTGVALQGSSMVLANTVHEADYMPFSGLGSFMASFGEHGGFGFGFHGWVTNLSSSILGISTEFDVFLDFHTSLSPLTASPPPTEVPEPATMFLLGSALLGISARRARKVSIC